MVIYLVCSMLFIQYEIPQARHVGPIPNRHNPSDPSGYAPAGCRASFDRIDEDNPGKIPAGGIIVSSPHGVAGDGRGWGEKKARLLACKLAANPTRVLARHVSLKKAAGPSRSLPESLGQE
jgi:hypothetical protein